jgi:hypothetical protein
MTLAFVPSSWESQIDLARANIRICWDLDLRFNRGAEMLTSKWITLYLRRKKRFSTENNVRPNRDDSSYVLFIMIDVDLGSERTIRCRYIKGPDIKSHKIRSVAFRSRYVKILLDTLFIHHLKLNSLYSMLHRSETKSRRTGRLAPWSLVVWLFEIPKCDGEKCCDSLIGCNDTLCAFWQW